MLILLVVCTDDGPGPELEPVILAKYIVIMEKEEKTKMCYPT